MAAAAVLEAARPNWVLTTRNRRRRSSLSSSRSPVGSRLACRAARCCNQLRRASTAVLPRRHGRMATLLWTCGGGGRRRRRCCSRLLIAPRRDVCESAAPLQKGRVKLRSAWADRAGSRAQDAGAAANRVAMLTTSGAKRSARYARLPWQPMPPPPPAGRRAASASLAASGCATPMNA